MVANSNAKNNLLCLQLLNEHPAGRTLISDWSLNSFIIVVYENILYFEQKILAELQHFFLAENHYKTIYGPVRSECSSYRMNEGCIELRTYLLGTITQSQSVSVTKSSFFFFLLFPFGHT